MTAEPGSEPTFDLDHYLSLPRVAGLVLAPDDTPEGEGARVWLLPAGGGEARPVAATPAGIDLLRVARDAGTVVYRTDVHPGADDLEADQRRDKARDDAGVSALLFETYPIRYWDHYLGPREPRLFAAAPPPADEGRMTPGRPLTPAPGRALDEVDVAVTPDGGTVVCGWDTGEVGNPRTLLVAIDVAGGERRGVLGGPAASVGRGACSPPGRLVGGGGVWDGDPGKALDVGLWLV